MIEEHDLAHLLQEHEAVRRELATLREAEEERARTEQALRESEARYRSLYNDTPVMLHSIDHDAGWWFPNSRSRHRAPTSTSARFTAP